MTKHSREGRALANLVQGQVQFGMGERERDPLACIQFVTLTGGGGPIHFFFYFGGHLRDEADAVQMSKGENTAATIYERDGIGDAHDSTAAKTKVAIIGSGLAGLHAAHLLSEKAEVRARFEVHLFEASGQIGLDGSSIAVDDVRIDVPLRSFNAGECFPLCPVQHAGSS